MRTTPDRTVSLNHGLPKCVSPTGQSRYEMSELGNCSECSTKCSKNYLYFDVCKNMYLGVFADSCVLATGGYLFNFKVTGLVLCCFELKFNSQNHCFEFSMFSVKDSCENDGWTAWQKYFCVFIIFLDWKVDQLRFLYFWRESMYTSTSGFWINRKFG